MAITLEGVRITNVKITDRGNFPIIKAIISGDGNFDTLEDENALIRAVLSKCNNVTALSALTYNSFRHPEYAPPSIQDKAAGTYTIGDDTGFKLSYKISKVDGYVNDVTNIRVYYKGQHVAYTNIYSAPDNSIFSTAFPIMFTDANNHVYNLGYNPNPISIMLRQVGDPGTDLLEGSYIVCNLDQTAELVDLISLSGIITLSGYDISGDIDRETDPEGNPPDPYSPGGPSGPGGGTGNFDGTSDTVPFPSAPTITGINNGFITLFATNEAGLNALANYLWSDLFSAISPGGSLEETITTLKRVVGNPIDAILGCSYMPLAVPTAGSKDVKMYGVLDSGVTLPYTTSRYIQVDCGTLNINEFWGAYLDYSPYTKVTSLFLPFVGVVSIDVDMIMGKALQVKYWVDILTGQCTACIMIDGSLEFQYQGHCGGSIPITSVDWTSTIQSGLNLVGSVANIVGSGIGGIGGGVLGAAAAAGGAALSKLPSMASDVMSSKPDIKSGSGIGGMAGCLSSKVPFLIIERPRQSLPLVDDLSQKHWTGYPSNMAAAIGDMTGYVEVSRVYVNRMTATANEKEEIERLLSEGVYI